MTKNDVVEKLVDQLLEMPTAIAEKQRSLIDQTSAVNTVENELALIENDLKQDINEALDTNGKKLYSNSDARDAAFLSVSKNHSELNNKRAEVELLKRKVQLERIEIERLGNLQRNIRTISYLFGGVTEEA